MSGGGCFLGLLEEIGGAMADGVREKFGVKDEGGLDVVDNEAGNARVPHIEDLNRLFGAIVAEMNDVDRGIFEKTFCGLDVLAGRGLVHRR